MGYLQALNLMVRAYKAARGVMPKGLDLLKLKMKARQKVIDANKVVKVDFSKGRKFFDEGIGDLIQKGKLFVGKAPKTKKTKPAVDPKLYQQERIKEIMKQNKEAAKRLEKKMNKDKKAEDYFKEGDYDPGGMANGGIANLTSVYNQNPSLQSQYTLDEYLDLFDNQTTTPQIQTSADILEQAQPNPINPIKPIIPIPESGDGGGGNPPPGGGISQGINLDYGYTSPGGTFNLDDIGEGTVADEDYTLGMRARDAVSGIMSSPFVKYNPMNPMFMFNVGKAGVEKAKEFAEQVRAQKALEEEQARQAQLNAARAALAYQTQTGEGSGYTGGFDPSTGNYDDPFDPGQTE